MPGVRSNSKATSSGLVSSGMNCDEMMALEAATGTT